MFCSFVVGFGRSEVEVVLDFSYSLSPFFAHLNFEGDRLLKVGWLTLNYRRNTLSDQDWLNSISLPDEKSIYSSLSQERSNNDSLH